MERKKRKKNVKDYQKIISSIQCNLNRYSWHFSNEIHFVELQEDHLFQKIVFAKPLKDQINETFQLIFNEIFPFAYPHYSFPRFHDEVLSMFTSEKNKMKKKIEMRLPKKTIQFFKLSSLVLHFQPHRRNMQRREKFKQLTHTPLWCQMFQDARQQNDDPAYSLFLFNVLLWVSHLSKRIEQSQITALMLPINHPQFYLLKRFDRFIERLYEVSESDDRKFRINMERYHFLTIIQNFILFHVVDQISKVAVNIFLDLFVTADAKCFGLFDNYPLLKKWLIQLHRIREDIDNLCEIDPLSTRFYLRNVSQESPLDLVTSIYHFILDPLVPCEYFYGIVQGLSSATLDYCHLPKTPSLPNHYALNLESKIIRASVHPIRCYDDLCLVVHPKEDRRTHTPFQHSLFVFLNYLDRFGSLDLNFSFSTKILDLNRILNQNLPIHLNQNRQMIYLNNDFLFLVQKN